MFSVNIRVQRPVSNCESEMARSILADWVEAFLARGWGEGVLIRSPQPRHSPEPESDRVRPSFSMRRSAAWDHARGRSPADRPSTGADAVDDDGYQLLIVNGLACFVAHEVGLDRRDRPHDDDTTSLSNLFLNDVDEIEPVSDSQVPPHLPIVRLERVLQVLGELLVFARVAQEDVCHTAAWLESRSTACVASVVDLFRDRRAERDERALPFSDATGCAAAQRAAAGGCGGAGRGRGRISAK